MAKRLSSIDKAILQLEAETEDLRREVTTREAVIGALRRSIVVRTVKAKPAKKSLPASIEQTP